MIQINIGYLKLIVKLSNNDKVAGSSKQYCYLGSIIVQNECKFLCKDQKQIEKKFLSRMEILVYNYKKT